MLSPFVYGLDRSSVKSGFLISLTEEFVRTSQSLNVLSSEEVINVLDECLVTPNIFYECAIVEKSIPFFWTTYKECSSHCLRCCFFSGTIFIIL